VAQLLADNGATVTMLTDDGRQVEVAKDFAQPYLQPAAPTPGLLPPQDAGVAPSPDLLAPTAPAEPAASDLLAPGMPAEQPSPDILPPAPGPPAQPSPDLLTPPAPQPVPPVPPPAATAPPPSVIPEVVPQTATQAAAMGLQGLQTQAEATQRGADAQAAGAGELVTAYDQAEQRLAEEQRLREQMAAYRAKEEAFLLAEKRTMVDRFKNFRVDRGRVFRQMDTGDQVLAGIGLALGAIGAAFTKADEENPAMAFLMKTLDRDVQLQLSERDQIGAAIGMKSDEIADFRQVSSSRLGEYNTRMAAHLARLEREVAKIAAKTQSATVKANADAFIGQLQQKGAEMLQAGVTADRSFNEQVRARRAAAANARAQLVEQQRGRDAEMLTKGFIPDPGAPGGYKPDPNFAGKPLSPADKLKQQELEQNERGSVVTDARGQPIGRARYGPTDAPKLAKYTADYESLRKTLSRLDEVIRDNTSAYGGVGSGRWPSEAKTEAESLRNDIAVRLAKIRDPESVAREGEVALALNDVPALDTWTTDRNPEVQYAAIVKTADDAYESQIGARIEYLDPSKSPVRIYEALDKARKSAGRERSREENVKALTSPLSTGSQQQTPQGKDLRTAELEAKQAAVPALLRTKPSIEELSTWGQKIEAERAAGRLTADEALKIMTQTAPRVLEEWRTRIQKMSTQELLKAQKDPEFFRRANILALLDSGAARPEEIYRLVVGQ
jgi:hypothetical protein